MDRSILLPFLFILGPVPATAAIAEPSPATYIMKVTSNLSCDTLDIVLISQADNTQENIRLKSSAFSAVNLPSGACTFGDVIYTKKEVHKYTTWLTTKITALPDCWTNLVWRTHYFSRACHIGCKRLCRCLKQLH